LCRSALSGGGYVVVWQDTSAVPNSAVLRDMRGQVFDADGHKIGGEFIVDQSGTTQVRAPSVAATANGGFVVSWADMASGTRARVFDQAGAALTGEFGVQDAVGNTVVQTATASMADGHYLVTWQELAPASGSVPAHYVVKAKVYGADNVALTTAFDLGPTNSTIGFGPSVAAVWDQFVIS